jgi:hypothetical protein
MATDTVVRARINARTKDEATAVLAAMGLSISDFIRMGTGSRGPRQSRTLPSKSAQRPNRRDITGQRPRRKRAYRRRC